MEKPTPIIPSNIKCFEVSPTMIIDFEQAHWYQRYVAHLAKHYAISESLARVRFAALIASNEETIHRNFAYACLEQEEAADYLRGKLP